MAYILGDSTAKRDGRLTLNPIRHVDPVGLICILLFQFGWAKPVMVDPRNLKNPKVDMALIAIAGPISNFVMAFLGLLILTLLEISVPNMPFLVREVIIQFSWLNVILGIFNLIPIPPLDGSKVIGGILPDPLYIKFTSLGRYGMLILLVAMFAGLTGQIIRPLANAIFSAFIQIIVRIFA